MLITWYGATIAKSNAMNGSSSSPIKNEQLQADKDRDKLLQI